MREGDTGVAVLGQGGLTPGTLASVRDSLPADHLSLWAEEQWRKMPRREQVLEERMLCPLDLEMLFGLHTITDQPEAAPALYLKASPATLAGPGEPLGLRPDVAWHVVHPALIAVFAPDGGVVGFSLGLDVTAVEMLMRHPAYLPEAKWFPGSAAMGSLLALRGISEMEAVGVHFKVRRRGEVLLERACTPGNVSKRLESAQRAMAFIPRAGWWGLMLPLSIALPDVFQLEEGDEVSVAASGLGQLSAQARWIEPAAGHREAAPRLLQIHPDDAVAVALDPISPGTSVFVAGVSFDVLDDIPFGHKVAVRAIAAGDWVTKYGEKIGVASRSINPGEHVHTHNLESSRGRGDLLTKDQEAR